jgi:hypothetical protein
LLSFVLQKGSVAASIALLAGSTIKLQPRDDALGKMAVDLAAQPGKRERGDNRQPLGNRDIAAPLIVSDLNQTPLNGIPAKEVVVSAD